MVYSEAAYFDGNHCAHCATRDDHIVAEWKRKHTNALIRNLKPVKRIFA